MRKLLLMTCAATAAMVAVPFNGPTDANAQSGPARIKTRLDHLSGTQWVLVVSYLSSEITSITCEKWTMLGVGSWKHQNDFTIPAGPAVAVLDANKFDGYCKDPGSIKAHTDDGDFVGMLDRGPGNWSESTKLTFTAAKQ